MVKTPSPLLPSWLPLGRGLRCSLVPAEQTPDSSISLVLSDNCQTDDRSKLTPLHLLKRAEILCSNYIFPLKIFHGVINDRRQHLCPWPLRATRAWRAPWTLPPPWLRASYSA